MRQVHLLESPVVEKYITTYPQSGSNTVDKVRYEEGKIWINDQQYFEGVPSITWNYWTKRSTKPPSARYKLTIL
jgi:hypothetical protein